MKKKKKKTTGVEVKLARRYYDPRSLGSFGGVEPLRKNSATNRKTIKNWLSFQDTYTLHKPVTHKFQRRRVIVGGIDHQWQADLIDVGNLKKANNGFVFLLTCIDVLSKFAWVIPLKNKSGRSIIAGFEHIFQQGQRKPKKLHTDKGTEFRNQPFQKFLKDNKVGFFVTENQEIKASVVERFNRTLKTRLWRMFTKKESVRYVEQLPNIVKSYNASFHRSIQRAPIEVTRHTQEDVWQTLYGVEPLKKERKLKKGDRVRITKAKTKFNKGYTETFTREKFTISRVQRTTPTTYAVVDDDGEELKGTFYLQELQKIEGDL